MKNITISIVASILLSIFSFSKAKAQDPVSGAAVAEGVYQAVVYTYNNWTKIKWVFGGMKHTWWYCRYQDGFVTYNNFRSYRTSADAWNYFVMGNGDCDAVYDDAYGRERHICYQTPFQARHYTNQHGPVVDIGYQGSDGRYRSILDY